mgnify:CR=1 FL=1
MISKIIIEANFEKEGIVKTQIDINSINYDAFINEKSKYSLDEHTKANYLKDVVLEMSQRQLNTFVNRLEILQISEKIRTYMFNNQISYSEALTIKKVLKNQEHLIDESVQYLLNSENIVNCTEVLDYAVDIIKYHHERFDGNGYPEGLKGYDIPFCARVVALADVYDALVTPRVYNKLYTHSEAMGIISDEKSKHFDPEIVEIFINNNELFVQIAKEYADGNNDYSC